MKKKRIAAFALPFLSAFFVAAATVHVPGDYPTIQQGIDAASDGDIVLVARGIYTGPLNRNLNFAGKAITVRSKHGPVTCIIDCEEDGRGFVITSGEGRNAVIQGFHIQNGGPVSEGGGIYCAYASPTIIGNVITGCEADYGAGIYFRNGSPAIIKNRIKGNVAEDHGGGIYGYKSAEAVIANNLILFNRAYEYEGNGGGICCEESYLTITGNEIGTNTSRKGGGIACRFSSPLIHNNILYDNEGLYEGGGIRCYNASPIITNNLFLENRITYGYGGGICFNDPDDNRKAMIKNNLFFSNLADFGGAIACLGISLEIRSTTFFENDSNWFMGHAVFSSASTVFIHNSIIWDHYSGEIYVDVGGPPVIWYSDVRGGYFGTGNIDADPQFVDGPQGQCYLSHVAAGQAIDSPCVNAGDPSSTTMAGTTRTDGLKDADHIDMGFHHPLLNVLSGPGPAVSNPPAVRVFPPGETGAYEYEFTAYGISRYGVKVSAGDLDGDGFDEILTGPGPGPVFGPHVRGFRVDGTALPGLNFIAYGTSKYGVHVSAGDIDGDGMDEIITGPGPGAVFGPHVRAFNYDSINGVLPVPGVNYFAYSTPKWGVNVAGGDIDGDGSDEILTGAGPGPVFAPHVRGWDIDAKTPSAIPGVNYFAYGTRRFGVRIAAGDIAGNGINEIITAPGPSDYFGSHIRGWEYDGFTVTPLIGCSFFAWNASKARYGACVFTGADIDYNGRDDLIVGAGPDPSMSPKIRVYDYIGVGVRNLFSIQAFPSSWTHGTSVAAGCFMLLP